MLELLKDYYVFMLVLMVFSYFVPRDEYKKYIQFFVGIFVVVLILKPVLELLMTDNPKKIYEIFEIFNKRMEGLELEIKEGESMYEYFFYKGERE